MAERSGQRGWRVTPPAHGLEATVSDVFRLSAHERALPAAESLTLALRSH
jgi:hypothetical protein